jgi:lipid-A-disaccharide synthase-like uncharacterized protein
MFWTLILAAVAIALVFKLTKRGPVRIQSNSLGLYLSIIKLGGP